MKTLVGCGVGWVVGWSDIALFSNFWKATRFCSSGIFLGSQFQKIGNFRRARRKHGKVFVFKKSQGHINICIKVFRILPYTYIKEQLPRRQFEIQSWLIFVVISKHSLNGFWSVQGEFGFLFSFCFLLSWRKFFVSGATFKNVNYKKMLANFTVLTFWGPATSENATLRNEILELGSYNNLAQQRMCSFLLFKITPP